MKNCIMFLPCLVLATSVYAHDEGESHRHAPTSITGPQTVSINEKVLVKEELAIIRLADPDDDPQKPSLEFRGSLTETANFPSEDCSSSHFSITKNDFESLRLKLMEKLDYETKQQHTVCITAWDDGDKEDPTYGIYNDGRPPTGDRSTWIQTIMVTVNVEDFDETINHDPEIADKQYPGLPRIYENAEIGVEVCCNGIRAYDDDQDELTYSLSGPDAEYFEFRLHPGSSTGRLYSKVSFDYESKSSYSVTVDVTDGRGGSDSVSINITVIDIADESSAPVFVPGDLTTYPPTHNHSSPAYDEKGNWHDHDPADLSTYDGSHSHYGYTADDSGEDENSPPPPPPPPPPRPTTPVTSGGGGSSSGGGRAREVEVVYPVRMNQMLPDNTETDRYPPNEMNQYKIFEEVTTENEDGEEETVRNHISTYNDAMGAGFLVIGPFDYCGSENIPFCDSLIAAEEKGTVAIQYTDKFRRLRTRQQPVMALVFDVSSVFKSANELRCNINVTRREDDINHEYVGGNSRWENTDEWRKETALDWDANDISTESTESVLFAFSHEPDFEFTACER